MIDDRASLNIEPAAPRLLEPALSALASVLVVSCVESVADFLGAADDVESLLPGLLVLAGCAEGEETFDVTAVAVGCVEDLVLAGLAGVVVANTGSLGPITVVASVRAVGGSY